MNKGMIYVFSGEGKGKTSSALGMILRTLMNNKSVVWISWFKNRDWHVSEMELDKHFPKLLEMNWMGKGFYIQKPEKKVGIMVKDGFSENDHRLAAQSALQYANDVLGKKDKPYLLVLDEVIQAIKDGLIREDKVLEVLSKRGSTHVVMTGRGVTERIVHMADLVTEMTKIKHPFDSGVFAIKGLDF